MRSDSPPHATPFGIDPELAERLGAIEGFGTAAPRRLSPTGPDAPTLPFGAIHEWFDGATMLSASDAEAGEPPSGRAQPRSARQRTWLPPLGVLIDLAWRSITDEAARPGQRVIWIGRRCWPYPHALIRRNPADPDGGGGGGDRRLLERSVLVDPPGRAERVWAIDVALRCAGVASVVADGSGLAMAASRRLQLAAAATGTLGLLARPGWERGALSAARTRWSVTPRPAGTHEQAWTLELLRCKGVQPSIGSARRWAVRRDHATGALDEWTACGLGVAAGVADRSAPPARSRSA